MSSTPMPESLAEGRFRLLEVIGEGGMATVYRAFDQRLQRPRAIKVLSPALSNRPSLRRRFLAEAQTMANLEESRVVRIFDTGEDGDRVFIVMELVEGGSLVDRVRDFGPLPPRMAAEATVQICESLQAAHDAGVIHRDIKPHNILLTRNGEIRITDFGIAQVQSDEDGMTKTGAVMGTWGFMAPEQKANAKQVDVRADLYSVGATLWSLLTGETPPELFMADAEPGMLEGIPEALAEVIKRSTRYRREDRYVSARSMADSLRALVPMLPEDPEITVPLVPPAFERQGKPLDTMQQFESEMGTGVEGSAATMIPNLAAEAAVSIEQPGPALVQPSVADSIVKEPAPPAPSSRLPLVLGGAALLLFGALALGVGAWVMWPAPTPIALEAPVTPPVTTPPITTSPAVPPDAPVATPPVATPPVAPPVVATPPVVSTPQVKDPRPKQPDNVRVETPPADPTPEVTTGIRHSAPSSVAAGESLAFTATLPSPGWVVKLYYRPASGGPFSEKTMVGAGTAYTTTVKTTAEMGGAVAYFISASKGSETLKVGSAMGPKRVTVN